MMTFPTLALALSLTVSTLAVGAKPTTQRGLASWYGSGFSKTASGEKYDPSSMTAAHRSLPFGTVVRVKNLANGKVVQVRINNRGPFHKGRIIDVSKAAAQELKMIKSGTAKVELIIVR